MSVHKRRVLVFPALALAWIVACSTASATVVITNLPNGTLGGSALNATDWKALIFSTGSSAWTIDNVVLGLNPLVQTDVPSNPKVEIALFSVVSGVPTTQLAATGLQTVNITALQQSYTLTTTGFQLAANTSYALVVRSDSSSIKWGSTSPATSPTASNGFTYTTFLTSTDSGTNWVSTGVSTSNALQVNATAALPVPVMADRRLVVLMSVLLGVTAFLMMTRRQTRTT
jgi:hypothetical protein